MGGEYLALVEDFKNSRHWAIGLGCIDCHGGDATSDEVGVAMSDSAGFIGQPERTEIPAFCGRCHSDSSYMKKYGNLRTDQVELYKTSIHGLRLFEQGDANVAVCSDCHSSHLVAASSNALSSTHPDNIPETCGRCHADEQLMAGYGLSATVVEDYIAGRHGQLRFVEDEIAAPVCTSCHGYHGAVPPGVESIHNVCGTCHLRTEQSYARSAHNEAFTELGFPKCITCHDNHRLKRPTDDLLLSEDKGGCLSCHGTDDNAYSTIQAIRKSLQEIREMQSKAEDLVVETERTTHLSMSEMTLKVESIRTKLLTLRAIQHAADIELVEENQAEAETAFAEIEQFTLRLIERGNRNLRIVIILGVLLFIYGLMMLYYTKVILKNR
jgi:hypothetical protein